MKILAFETSCDETSVAVVEDGTKILSNIISTQIDIHKEYGGVVPEIASRHHIENILPVFNEALERAGCRLDDIDYIAVTNTPGLIGSLLVGLMFAKSLSYANNIPLIPVNHITGHIFSNFIENDVELPAVSLVVSGGHTNLYYIEQENEKINMELLGETLDDAVGEAFDKVGRMLNFGYPGGPVVCEFAKKGKKGDITFTIPMKKSGDLNFSYSGLKTAALYKTKELREEGKPDKVWVYDFCRGFLDTIIESLNLKLNMALEKNPEVKTLFVGGGVFNSEEIVRKIGSTARSYGLNYIYSDGEYRGDNAGMIGVSAYFNILNEKYITDVNEIRKVDRDPRLSL